MWILIYVSTLNYNIAAGRVYCQDAHATKWRQEGFSCPVNCNNVVHAVERIKMLDRFQKYAADEDGDGEFENITTLGRQTNGDATTDPYLICETVLQNLTAVNEVQNQLTANSTICQLVFKKAVVKPVRLKMRKCTRRNYENVFVSVFTDTLNRHAHGKYRFTERKTSLILKRLLGEKISLRHGVSDVTELLLFLKRALQNHRLRSIKSRITLKSRHCLNLYVPGCYCIPGYVENFGQCVQPVDCFSDTPRFKYLSRVRIE